jgi:thioredoxin 1
VNRSLKYILSGVILGALLLSLSCGGQSEAPKNNPNDPVSQILSGQEFDNIVKNTKETLIVFDLYADWCGPCRLLAPVYNELAATHGNKVKFYRVNVDKTPEVASALQVRGIPYVIFLRNGEMVHAIQGLNPKEAYEKVITACGSVGTNDDCRKNLESTL